MNAQIKNALVDRSADIVRFIDISMLDKCQAQDFTKAIVFGMALTKKFILDVYNDLTTDYSEFGDKEHKSEDLADWLADYIRQKGYDAYSQSTENNWQNGNFDEKTKSIRLPVKTLARLAGIGYIGKNNLLVNDEYGCALTLSAVLTNAPVATEEHSLILSKCGDCNVCQTICSANAVHGNEWTQEDGREFIIDVLKCTCCLKCMINCPKTLKYANQITE